MAHQTIEFKAEGAIARIAFNRPDRLNSFTAQMRCELRKALDLQRDEMRRLGFTKDYREGVTAFLEKRPAKFPGR